MNIASARNPEPGKRTMILLRLFILPFLAMGGGPLAAQSFWVGVPPAQIPPAPGMYTNYGTGCGRSQFPQTFSRLTATGRPVLGGTVRVHHNIPQWPRDWWPVHILLLTGLSATRAHGFPLPLDLNALIPQWFRSGCFLYTSGEISLSTQGIWDFRIPNDPGLLGLTLYQQWIVVLHDMQWQVAWAQVSNGGIMMIGR